jgi:hypothetical protein
MSVSRDDQPNLREIMTLVFLLHGSFETRDLEIRDTLIRALYSEVRKLDPELFDDINQSRANIRLADLQSVHREMQNQ